MAEKNEKEMLKAVGLAVVVIILAVISALVIGAVLDSSVFDGTTVSGTNTNESLGVVDNVTNVTFAIISTQPTAVCNLGGLFNATGGELIIGAGNYTFYTDCKIIMQSGSPYNNVTLLNVTYEFVYTDESGLIVDVDDVSDKFGEFIDGLLGFLGIIGIVLGVMWLIMYVAKLFSKGGLNDLGSTA